MKYIKLVLLFYLLVVTIFVFKITGQIYGVNDDVIIQNWLSGVFTGRPEFMIRGSATPKITYGLLLSILYAIIPSINWFPLSLLALTLISWLIIGLISFRSKNYYAVISYLILSFLHLLWFIPNPTYTAASIILSFSALSYISINLVDKKFTFTNPILFLLLSISYLIRPESFFLGSAVALPFIFFAIAKNTINYKLLVKKFSISVILLIGIIAIDFSFEKIYYSQNKDWVIYSKWEDARYKIQANAPEAAVSENPQNYGWTRAEVELFKTYNFVDKDTFSTDKFNDLLKQTSSQKSSFEFMMAQKAHQKLFDSGINWNWVNLISMISLFYFLFFFASFPKIKNYLVFSLLSLGVLYFMMLYVAGFLRQPERVQLSAIFISNLISLISFSLIKKPALKFYWGLNPILNAFILVIILNLSSAQISIFKNKVGKTTGAFWIDQTSYLGTFPQDAIFIGNASQFRNNYVSPYFVNYFDVEDRIFTFGWHNFSPHWDLRARQLGLDPDNILKSVIDDPRVYWVSGQNSMNYIVEFMNEKNLTFSGPTIVGKMENFGVEYLVWKFSKND
jgi:hypothetical protein